MSLLTICKQAATEVGIADPNSIIASPQQDSIALLRYATKVGTLLMKKVAWQILRKEKTFTSIASETQTSILPSDFDRFVPETFWDRSALQLITGPVSSVEWQSLKASSYAGARPKFAYRGGDVLILPTMGAGNALAFEYISKNWCASSGGTPQSAWAADTDVGIVDEELIIRGMKFAYLTDKGLPNTVAAGEFKEYFDILVGNDQPDASIMTVGDIFGSGRHFDGVPASSYGLLL